MLVSNILLYFTISMLLNALTSFVFQYYNCISISICFHYNLDVSLSKISVTQYIICVPNIIVVFVQSLCPLCTVQDIAIICTPLG